MSEPAPLLAPLKPKLVAARLWRDGSFVADVWRNLADDEPWPISGRGIVTLARWRREQGFLISTRTPVGVRTDVADVLDGAADDLPLLGVIALPFPKFSDGRSYSVAKRLREAGYAGEVRATGDVLLDQLPLMLRAGFDAFELVHAATVAALEAGAVPAVPQVYQRGATRDAAAAVFRRRQA